MLKPARLRALSSCHRAGMTWPQAVAATLEGEATLPSMLRALEQDESTLSEALAPVLDPVGRALIRAGETSGTLEQALLRVAEEQETDRRDAAQRRVAIAYPLFVAHIGAVLAAVPDFIAGRWAQGLLWSAAVLGPVYAALFLMRRLGSRRLGASGRLFDDAGVLRAFGACVEAGVPLDEAAPLARQVAPLSRAGLDLARVAAQVERREELAPAWQELDEDARSALVQAEHVGELGAVAKREAGRLREEAVLRSKVGMARLPVLVMLVVGAVVGWRIFSFYADYLSMGFDLKR